jgi:hypothetical protein
LSASAAGVAMWTAQNASDSGLAGCPPSGYPDVTRGNDALPKQLEVIVAKTHP